MTPKRSRAGAAPVKAGKGAAEPATVLPGWAVPALYALVCVLLFHEFVLGPAQLLGTDTMATGYFARNFYTQFVRTFQAFPLWDPLLFGGLPFIDGMHGDIFYPPSLSLFFMNAAQAWGWKMILHVFLAGIFAYLWLRELGARRAVAMFGGLVYMMGADLVSLFYPGGDGKLFVSALAPLAFLLTERAVSRRRLSDFAWLSLGVALLVFTSHMQLVYFAIWGISLYAIFRLAQWWRAERKTGAAARYMAAFALAGVLGVGAAAIQFFPPLGYLRTYSHRAEKTEVGQGESAYQYSTTYSLHPEEIASLVVPEFVGDDIQHADGRAATYWGRNPFKINHEFAGFIPLFLLPILFLRRRSPLSWFLLGLGALALLYTLGADTPAFRLFYKIPGVRLFRAPSLIIFLYALSLATLGAFALDRALAWAHGTAEDTRSVRRYLWLATGVFALLAVLAASGTLLQLWQSVFPTDISNPEQLNAHLAALSTNAPYIRRGFAIAFVLALFVTGTWEGLARGVLTPNTAFALITVLAFLDLYRVDRPFIKGTTMIADRDHPLFNVDEGTAFLQGRQQSGEVFRALHDPGMRSRIYNLLAVHGVEQLAGHHGNEIGRYRELVGGDELANMDTTYRLLDVTNTRYIVVGGLLSDPSFVEAYRGNRMVVYRRPSALPRAYLVGQTEVVPDSAAVARMLSSSFDYRNTALLPESLPSGVQIQPGPQGEVEWLERTANAFRLRVQTDRPALLMVLDNYYPMWRAEVDGQPVEILRANFTFRAIPVGAGQHDIWFRYVPSNVRAPALLSALLLVLLVLAGLGPGWLKRFRPTGTQP